MRFLFSHPVSDSITRVYSVYKFRYTAETAKLKGVVLPRMPGGLEINAKNNTFYFCKIV